MALAMRRSSSAVLILADNVSLFSAMPRSMPEKEHGLKPTSLVVGPGERITIVTPQLALAILKS